MVICLMYHRQGETQTCMLLTWKEPGLPDPKKIKGQMSSLKRQVHKNKIEKLLIAFPIITFLSFIILTSVESNYFIL